MATEKQTDNFIGIGWSFPPAFDASSRGVETTEQAEDIERSLQILLSTRQGERVMEPKYGCNLDELLFESLSTFVKTIIIDKIKVAILFFESRIKVESITLDDDRELEGLILIEITYMVKATNSRFNFVYPFYKNEGTELELITNTPIG